MIDLKEPIEVRDLDAELRIVEKTISQLDAPLRQREAAAAKRDALKEQIAAQKAAEAAQRRAAQQREDETAALRRRYDDLREPVRLPFDTTVREAAVQAHHIAAQLVERGITVAPIVWDLEQVARPWVEQAALIQEAMRRPAQPPIVEAEADDTEEEPTDEHD
jgi:predicted nuclease with TOPRIM domain